MKLDSVVLLGVLAYIGNMLKGYATKLLTYLLRIFSSNICADTEYTKELVYLGILDYIKELNSEIVNNSISPRTIFDDDRNLPGDKKGHRLMFEVSPGSYFVKKNLFNYITFSINRKEKQDSTASVYSVDLSIIGFNHKELMKEVIAKINERFIKASEMPSLKSITYRGGVSSSKLPCKSIDTIFIHKKDYILKRIHEWQNLKPVYERNGIVHKFGILLSGEPGTGKSSLALALANHLGYDLCITSTIPERYVFDSMKKTIILFEDIDCLFDLESRDDDTNKKDRSLTLNPFLQLLDGVNSPEDTIFILTTNHKEQLDTAIYRPGRINLDIEMGKISKALAGEMCDSFGVSHSLLANEEFPINPSYLQNKILLSLSGNEVISLCENEEEAV